MPDTKQLSQRSRAAEFIPSTFNEGDYTIDVVAATDNPVLQMGWEGVYSEILSMEAGHVRLDRLNNGANVLDNHNRYSSVTTAVLGVVRKAWLDGGKLRATIQLSKRPELASFVQDVREGIQRNISINYRVYQVEITTGGEKMDTYRATDWEPCEISFVSVPADYLSTVRSASDQPASLNDVTIILHSKNRNMPEQKEGATITTPVSPASGATENNTTEQVNVDNERKLAAKNERNRSSEIMGACRAAGFDLQYAEGLIADETMTVDKARAAIIAKLAENQPNPPRSASVVTITDDEQVKEREAIQYAMLHRSAPGDYPLNKANDQVSTLAANFRGISVLDAAKLVLGQRGMKVVTFSKQELYERSMSTADFPNLLANVANKFLRADYTQTPQTFKALATQQNLPDFKLSNGVQFGGEVNLEEVKEGAEFKHGSLIETVDNWKLSTYGKILKFTRQMFINDDLGGFTRIAKRIAIGASNNESNIFWALITGNVKMLDGVVLFHSTHANLAASGGAISATTMDTARTAMKRQKGLNSKELIDIMPKYIVVAPEQEFAVDQLLTNITPNQTGQVNPFPGSGLVKIVEPRLASGAWYVFAEPCHIEGFTYGYLEGNEGLYTETRWGFNVDGVEMKCRQDFAAKAWDWRGVYKNAGS